MALSTNIYAEITTTFPASVEGAGGITITKSGGVYTITWSVSGIAVNSIDNGKLEQVTGQRLIGNPTGTAADRSEISLGGDLEFRGTLLQGAALTGDVAKAAGSAATDITSGAVTTVKILDANVTTAKLAPHAVDGTKISNLAVDTEHLASSAVETVKIAARNVTYSKLLEVAASKILGRGDSGAGDAQQITLGANLTMTGTTLAASSAALPSGCVVWHAVNSPPIGFLECDGSAVSRTTYADLFTAIGTTFGVGDGSTTFNLPNLQGEFVRGWDNARGIDSGRVFGSAQTDEFKSHSHVDGQAVGRSTTAGADSVQFSNSDTHSTSETGGEETRPRNVALLPCIKF